MGFNFNCRPDATATAAAGASAATAAVAETIAAAYNPLRKAVARISDLNYNNSLFGFAPRKNELNISRTS